MGFKVAAIFSDNMVLQRNKQIAVFGEGAEGTCIRVSIQYMEEGVWRCNEEQTIVSGGKWCLYLPPMKENADCRMAVTDGESKREFCNIAVGEVWFCGGQSNMEFELQNITGGKDFLQKDAPNVRFYNVQRKAFVDEAFLETEARTKWDMFDSESAKTWSAVGYLFGKKLSETLGVTVGLVGCNWGGTSASAWMSREYLLSDSAAATYMDEYEKAVEGKDEEALIQEYKEYLLFEVEWNKKCDALYAAEPDISWDEVQKRIGICQWPGPMCQIHPFRPAGLYETMLKRIIPYTGKGWIYYQGESDDHKPHGYYRMMDLLIKQWRADWKDAEMPFLFVQLPGHQYKQDEDRKNWCIIREAQAKIARDVKGTGMAVLIDAGEYDNIHPLDKVPVGDRLYRQAMYQVYGGLSLEEAQSPVFDFCQIEKDKVIVIFKNVSSGLKTVGEHQDVIGFEMAGEDEVYHSAKAHIDGNQVVVYCDEVKEPVAVRYLWTNYPKDGVNLFNRYGLPVAPFRSVADDEGNLIFPVR